MAKLRKHFSLQLKRPKFCNFWGLKLSEGKTKIQTIFFLEILKAVCLSVDWVPKLIQNFFPTMEQELVQRCETEIVVDACIASYCFSWPKTYDSFQNRLFIVFQLDGCRNVTNTDTT